MLIILLCALLIIIYHIRSYEYWENKKIFNFKGQFLFGNLKNVFFGRMSLIELFSSMYKDYKSEGLVGFYSFYRPMLLVTQPDLIKEVLVRNFNSFSDVGFRIYKEADPLFGINPFCTTGLQNWKLVRGIDAPFHSPRRLKEMLPIMKKTCGNMVFYVKSVGPEPIEILDVTGNYTLENVIACFYGLEPCVFSDPENAFKTHATTKLFSSTELTNLSALFFPKLAKILNLRIVSKYAEDFFVSIVKSLVELRTKQNVRKNDFINHLMNYHHKKLEEGKPGLTDLEFAGHCMTVYLDGYETSSSVLSFTFLELANNVMVQEKLRGEILSVGESLNDFDFETVNELPYLHMVLKEVLRMHPVLPVLSRECTADICINNTLIERGTKVFIPVKCLHLDADFYPEPLCFKPERFAEEDLLVNYPFLAFGEGPRKCLGFKFALLQLKLAVIAILLNFKVANGSARDFQRIKNEEKAPFVVLPKRTSKLIFHAI